jgi:hypothetical protein
LFDVKKVQAEAEAEIAADRAQAAKTKIKAKLKQISDAERIVTNLRAEYDVLLADIGNS